MIEQQGKVVSAVDGVIRVRLGASSGCSACDAGKGCGAGVFGRLLQRKPVILEFQNSIDAAEGQAVMVGLPESLFLSLVFRLYLFPLLAGLGGAMAGHWLAGLAGFAPALTDFSALVGGLICAAWVIRHSRRGQIEFSDSFTVHLLRTASCTNS